MSPPDGTPDDDEDRSKKTARKSASTVLVEIGMEMFDFRVSTGGEPFAIPKDGPKLVYLLRGGKASLRKQLAREYFARTGRAAPQQALADALLVLDGASQNTDELELATRVARVDGALWLDLGDPTGQAVRIDGSGWSIEAEPPVLFRRSELTGALPEPRRGGRLDDLWGWINVADADRPLVVALLVAALLPDIPHPVLGLFGEQGTGKSTAQKIIVSIIDPGPVPLRKAPRDAESWVTAAAGSWVVGLDNLSDVSDWLSDSICRAVTGDGDVRRRLYTDGELAVFSFRRVVILNGIDLGAVRGDLADRLAPVDLVRIDDAARIDDNAIWPAFTAAHPEILGALLGEASEVLRLLPSVRLELRPRMSDFAKILSAVDMLHDTAGLDHYVSKQKTLASESLQADPFITALAAKLTDTFDGTSAELLDRLTPGDEKWKAPKGWPPNARAVTQLLRRQGPVMRKQGWCVADDAGSNKSNAIRWAITPPSRVEEMGRDSDSPYSLPRQNGAGGELASQASLDPYPSLLDQADGVAPDWPARRGGVR